MADATLRGNTLTASTIPGNPAASEFSALRLRASGLQRCRAYLDALHGFSTVLTGDERVAVYNSGTGQEYASFSSAVQNKALFSYGLGEASAATTLADSSTNGRTLTVQGSLTQVAGKVGNAQSSAASPYDDYAWRSGTGMGGTLGDFEVDLWINFQSLTGGDPSDNQFFAGVTDASQGWTWAIYSNRHSADASCRFQFDYGDGLALVNNSVVRAQTFGAPTTATWYHLNARYDYSENKASICINGGAPDSVYPVAQPTMRPSLIWSGGAAGFTAGTLGLASGGLEPGGVYDVAGEHYASRASPGNDLKFTNTASKMGGCWIKPAALAANMVAAGIWNLSGNAGNWMLQWSGGALYFLVGNGSGSFDFCNVALNDTLTHAVMFWFDVDAGTINIDLDHGALTDSKAKTVTIGDPGTPFYFGAMKSGSGTGQQFEGTLDAFWLADGKPTQADKDNFWNVGNGTESLVAYDVTTFPYLPPVQMHHRRGKVFAY